jgi:hypothetical protein
MGTSSVFASQSVMFTMAAAPPSIQQAALHRPVLEKAEAATTITPDVIANALAIALTVSHSSFLITGLLVPCSLFLAAATHALLISRALVALGSRSQSAVLLFTLLPFASRRDILLALLISAARMALMSVTSPLLSTIAAESVAIIFDAAPGAAGRHHYLIAATAMGLCASTDYDLQVFMFCFYCAVAAMNVFRLVQPYVAK